jgi:hypothetical protein
MSLGSEQSLLQPIQSVLKDRKKRNSGGSCVKSMLDS